MNAMLLRQPHRAEDNPLEFARVETPIPRDDEIRIAVRVCGVCHTDLHTVEGELALPKLPIIPGHQIVGVVESIGARVTRFRVGERVGVAWLNWTCGACEYCARGLENLCENARFTGQHADGGYAEYVVVNENFAYKIPDAFDDAHAAPLLCGGIIGYRALRVCGVQRGERLGLYGFGSSAHIVLQIARHWECEVYVFTRSEEHRALARQLGAVWTGRAGDTPPRLLDRAIVFAPVGDLVRDALRVLRKGGVVAHAGVYSSPIPQLDYPLLYHERVVTSVANSTRQDAEELLRIAAAIPVKTEIEIFPLREANRALQLLKASQIRGSAVLTIEG
ncbi:MAG: zinc-dependent alcohol dehydrogenase family protein [Anaerolineae bacterium]|nr:zinc-dependent alcohol dehydrogenase family protein [Anaerolineae bacterium]